MKSTQYNPAAEAARALHTDAMVRFGEQLEWLADPTVIPDESVDTLGHYPSGYMALAAWMLLSIESWNSSVHNKLNWGGIFEKFDLPNYDRVGLRDSMKTDIIPMYAPGIMAMAEIHEVVPKTAASEGVSDPQSWGDIAQDAKRFGRAIGRSGTVTQGILRTYFSGRLDGSLGSFNPHFFKLDSNTGITSIEPVKSLVDTALELNNEVLHEEGSTHECLAFGIPLEAAGGMSLYDAAWRAYNQTVRRLIYPNLELVEADFDPPESNLTLEQAIRHRAAHHQSLRTASCPAEAGGLTI